MKVCRSKKHLHSVVVYDGPVVCPMCEYLRNFIAARKYSRKLERKLDAEGFWEFIENIPKQERE